MAFAVLCIPFGWWSKFRANRYYERLKKRGVTRGWAEIEHALPRRQSFLLLRQGPGRVPEIWWTQIDVLDQFEQEEQLVVEPLSAWKSKKFKKWLSKQIANSPDSAMYRTQLDIEFPILDGGTAVRSILNDYPDCTIAIVDVMGWLPIANETGRIADSG